MYHKKVEKSLSAYEVFRKKDCKMENFVCPDKYEEI